MDQGRVVRRELGGFWTAGSNAEGRFELMVEDVTYLREVPLHIHEAQEDSFYVLNGVLTVQIGEEIIELHQGDFASAPAGVPHTFTNTNSKRTARMLNVMSPAIGFDRLVEAARAGRDRPELERLAAELGLHIVGPSLPTKLGLH